jgi:hypothetical protein
MARLPRQWIVIGTRRFFSISYATANRIPPMSWVIGRASPDEWEWGNINNRVLNKTAAGIPHLRKKP